MKTFMTNILKIKIWQGFSVNIGIKNSTNDIILIQDADLEYLPENYENLLKPFKDYDADVVYGLDLRLQKLIGFYFFFTQ